MASPITNENKLTKANAMIDEATMKRWRWNVMTVSTSDAEVLSAAVHRRLYQHGVRRWGYLLIDIGPVFKGQGVQHGDDRFDTRVLLLLFKRTRAMLASTLTPY